MSEEKPCLTIKIWEGSCDKHWRATLVDSCDRKMAECNAPYLHRIITMLAAVLQEEVCPWEEGDEFIDK